jgi:CRP-like cAMP-binding protein
MSNAWTHVPAAHVDRAKVRRRVDEQVEMLRRSVMFGDLSARQLREIAKVSGSARYDAGAELLSEGAAGMTCFLIVDGTAKVVRGGRTLKRLGPGEFVGEMSLLTTTPRSASVIAQTPLECITLTAKGLRSVLLANPPIALKMLTTMAGRLAEVDRRLTG